eukprot:scaffold14980_cov421-Alexandrium_tamarense.AAC.1
MNAIRKLSRCSGWKKPSKVAESKVDDIKLCLSFDCRVGHGRPSPRSEIVVPPSVELIFTRHVMPTRSSSLEVSLYFSRLSYAILFPTIHPPALSPHSPHLLNEEDSPYNNPPPSSNSDSQ